MKDSHSPEDSFHISPTRFNRPLSCKIPQSLLQDIDWHSFMLDSCPLSIRERFTRSLSPGKNPFFSRFKIQSFTLCKIPLHSLTTFLRPLPCKIPPPWKILQDSYILSISKINLPSLLKIPSSLSPLKIRSPFLLQDSSFSISLSVGFVEPL